MEAPQASQEHTAKGVEERRPQSGVTYDNFAMFYFEDHPDKFKSVEECKASIDVFKKYQSLIGFVKEEPITKWGEAVNKFISRAEECYNKYKSSLLQVYWLESCIDSYSYLMYYNEKFKFGLENEPSGFETVTYFKPKCTRIGYEFEVRRNSDMLVDIFVPVAAFVEIYFKCSICVHKLSYGTSGGWAGIRPMFTSNAFVPITVIVHPIDNTVYEHQFIRIGVKTVHLNNRIRVSNGSDIYSEITNASISTG